MSPPNYNISPEDFKAWYTSLPRKEEEQYYINLLPQDESDIDRFVFSFEQIITYRQEFLEMSDCIYNVLLTCKNGTAEISSFQNAYTILAKCSKEFGYGIVTLYFMISE